MPRANPLADLSRRERQIMEVVYRLGRASVANVLDRLPQPPSYSAVRALMRILEHKGQLRHEREGARYVYLPVTPRATVRDSALRQLVETFFEGSREAVVAALLDARGDRLSEEALERIARMVEEARRRPEN